MAQGTYKSTFTGKRLLAAISWIVLAYPGISQTVNPAAKPHSFEVVSIRPTQGTGRQEAGPTPDGYRMRNMPMLLPILSAYVPSTGAAMFVPDQMAGFPDWVGKERFDIDARVSEADLSESQKPGSQQAMLRAMLQAMLTDRLKLTVHRSMKEVSVYSLVVMKNGPKFKESDPAHPHPGGFALPGGGGMIVPSGDNAMHFADVTMPTLVSVLSGLAGRPVQDKTGLTGKYDLVLQKPLASLAAAAEPGAVTASEPGPSLFTVVEELGLKMESTKGQTETLVLDRIERPSPN